MNLFYKGRLDKRNAKEAWQFLKDHFTYYTLNSWNLMKSIANNVKMYNLQLDGSYWVARDLMIADDYYALNSMIRNWQNKHPGYVVGFNGRSDGYLVLYNEKNYNSVLPDWVTDYDNYEDFKQYAKDYYGSLKEMLPTIIEYVNLVQDFDKLCDELRDYVNYLSLTNMEAKATEELERVVEVFNDSMQKDLELLEVKELEVKDRKVDTSALKAHPALALSFETILQNGVSEMYEVIDEADYIWLKYKG